jgi:signal transduction histidine kinase
LIAHFSFDGTGVPVRAAGVAHRRHRAPIARRAVAAVAEDGRGRQLAGGIAHEFNNLLTVIQGCAEFLSDALPEPDERRGDVEQIHGTPLVRVHP